MLSRMQEFTATGNERECRFVQVIVKNACENRGVVGRKKEEKKKSMRGGKSRGQEKTRYTGLSARNLQVIFFKLARGRRKLLL